MTGQELLRKLLLLSPKELALPVVVVVDNRAEEANELTVEQRSLMLERGN